MIDIFELFIELMGKEFRQIIFFIFVAVLFFSNYYFPQQTYKVLGKALNYIVNEKVKEITPIAQEVQKNLRNRYKK